MHAEPLADHAAERDAAAVEALEAGCVGHRQHVAREQLDRVLVVRCVGRAVTPHVHPDHVEEVGEPRHHRVPQAVVGAQ
jgi:hypothetical protein